MASSNFPGRPFALRENVWVIRQDIGGNATLVGWQLWVDKTGYSPTFSGNGFAYRDMRLDGAWTGAHTNPGFDFRGAGPWQVHGGERWIGHNGDGSKYLDIAGHANYDMLGATDVYSGFWLPHIPRVSTASFNGPDMHSLVAGQNAYIVTNRASGDFIHDLDWYFGNATGRALTAIGHDGNWTVPLSLLDQIPHMTTGVGTMRTHTYTAGYGQFIGYTETAFRIHIPTSFQPNFTTITASEATAGVASNVGAYVQNVSKLNLAITGAVSSGYSASIPAPGGYYTEVAGQGMAGQSSVTPKAISQSGTVTIKGRIMDTRGLTKEKTITINVLPWQPPKINSIKVERALANGTVDEDDGTYLKVSINASVTSLMNSTQRNQLRYRISTRLRGATSWTLKSNVLLPIGTLSFNNNVLIGTYPITQSHEILVEIVDDFATSAIQQMVGVAKIFSHWDADRGMGIGKFREFGMLDVAGDIYTRGRIVASSEWAAKAGPLSVKAAYVNVWNKGIDSGGSIDAHTNPDYIIIGETGIYEVEGRQRGAAGATPDADYFGIALDGVRSAMEDRVDGAWDHDHVGGNSQFAFSRYIGRLTAGERITGGPPSTVSNLYFGAANYAGGIFVRRIS